jgi:hypothetical protein
MRPHPLSLVTALTILTAPVLAAGDQAIDRPVDLALILLTDVSNSMSDREYAMVKEGYKAAFSDPEVIKAILDNSRGVAIAYVEFSGKDEFIVVKGWDVVTDAGSARTFGESVAAATRSSNGNTALAVSLRKAAEMLKADGIDTDRRVIDVASDHPNDDGRAAAVRDAAVSAGITINALPIVDAHPMVMFDGHLTYAKQQWGFEDPVEFYRNHVIGGPGSFLVEARDYVAFGEALKRKLLRELISSPGPDRISGTLATAD